MSVYSHGRWVEACEMCGGPLVQAITSTKDEATGKILVTCTGCDQKHRGVEYQREVEREILRATRGRRRA